MQPPLTPINESDRLEALYATGLLDTPSELRFDRLTQLVQLCLGSDIVLVSLIDTARQWFKSKQGVAVCETHRDISFCGHAVLADDIFEVTDASLDPRFTDNPLVTDAPFIRFYAGAPLTVQGERIGTLCIIDAKPRQLNAKERQILRKFADAVEQEIIDRQQEYAEVALNASRDQFESLVANIPGITYRCDADEHWTMRYMSSSIDPLSGYPASDFIANSVRSYSSVIHPDDTARVETVVADAVLHRHGWILQYRVIHKDGRVIWVEERGKAGYDSNNNVRYLDGFILDISEEKKLKHQLITLTSQLPGAVYQYQQWPDGRVAFPYASAAIRSIYGLTPAQVKDDASVVFSKICSEDLPALAHSIERSRQQLTVWQCEYRLRRDDGAIAWILGKANPERMLDGSTLWHGYIQDITETKQHYLQLEQVNQQLHLAQQRLDTASENALIGFWQESLTHDEVWWSPIIYHILGFEQANTVPSVALLRSVVHPDDRQLVAESDNAALETGTQDVVHRIIRSDGSIRWVHELARVLTNADNEEQFLIGSVQDVTERMQLQQLKNEFISTVSHELRTPLTSIKGALSLLNSGTLGQLPETISRLINVAYSNSDRLSQLINDLLDIEKLAAGKMNFELQTVSLFAELEHTVMNLQPYAHQFTVQLRLEPIASAIQITVDTSRLQQILTNLVSNAIKFSAKDAVVTLNATPTTDSVRIDITDTGVGIAPEFHTRVFERFAQADSSNNRQTGGTGLGLAICKELVEKMGGQIGFDSVFGEGSTFYIILPLNKQNNTSNVLSRVNNENIK
ncbi:PAS domain S-box protein [Rheinheimera sp. D18]|uniref:PAS domain-containing protein n=1 Tax=Rheinheimera sp. D18 TaxID=2545632 RepID=UPI00104994A0|nr:PAS domain-containing protein [Rheinheimera sp. D18]QBL08581.1 PAS domain S-box protein [Rheinheimera sp. D18]